MNNHLPASNTGAVRYIFTKLASSVILKTTSSSMGAEVFINFGSSSWKMFWMQATKKRREINIPNKSASKMETSTSPPTPQKTRKKENIEMCGWMFIHGVGSAAHLKHTFFSSV